jgi:hypothetical protein
MRGDDRTRALHENVAELLAMPEPRKRYGALMSGLDVRYDLGLADIGAHHPLLGRRMPDLDVVTEAGPQRVSALLHEARPVLLDLRAPRAFDIGSWAERIRVVNATYDGAWELPVVGQVSAPAAVLVRPDGYVAWVADDSERGLRDALATWFGPSDRRPM